MTVKMNEDLRNRREAWIEKIQEMFNKDIEELQNKQTVMNNTITEMRDFSGCLVVRTSPFNAGDVGSIPGQRAKISHALRP